MLGTYFKLKHDVTGHMMVNMVKISHLGRVGDQSAIRKLHLYYQGYKEHVVSCTIPNTSTFNTFKDEWYTCTRDHDQSCCKLCNF